MNEAFEKILERLILESSSCEVYKLINPNKEDIAEFNTYKKCIEIVKEAAEEYNGGWIPCSERLPEEHTVLCCDKYGEMIVGCPYFDEVSDTNYSAESDNEMMYDCVAWQPLPELYKERD